MVTPRSPLIPFPSHARPAGEPELPPSQRRRADVRDERRSAPRRRARRRRQSTPWLQRNALAVAAASILVAFLGLGFGLVQAVRHADSPPAAEVAASPTEMPLATTTTLNASSLGPSATVASPVGLSVASASPARPIQASARVLEANYTIVSGDTLVKIATRFNTTAERIQALNNLADPRALRVGTRLVIPPPL